MKWLTNTIHLNVPHTACWLNPLHSSSLNRSSFIAPRNRYWHGILLLLTLFHLGAIQSIQTYTSHTTSARKFHTNEELRKFEALDSQSLSQLGILKRLLVTRWRRAGRAKQWTRSGTFPISQQLKASQLVSHSLVTASFMTILPHHSERASGHARDIKLVLQCDGQ